MEGCANFCVVEEEPEIQLPHVTVVIAEGVGVLLEQQIL
jgi:hypothetical protein